MSDARLRCAYLVSRYPAVTHTFILGEVRGMRAAGVEVDTASVRRQQPEEVLSPADEREFRTTHALLPTTSGRLVTDHARALRRSPRAWLRTLAAALRMNVRGARGALWQVFYFAEALLLWAWMDRRGLRHVHVHFANPAADVAMLAVRFGNAAGPEHWSWSLTVHGPTELEDPRGHKLGLKARDAVLVVCTSQFARAAVARAAGGAADNLRVVHCGIDVQAFSPNARAKRLEGPLELMNVAAMSARKGQALLLDALADLRAQAVDVRLTIVGDGPERGALEAQARALGVADRVAFEGAVAHQRIASYLHRADVFCLPSYAEGVPTVLMEAMASGLAVVATRVYGIPELVEDGRSGLLVPPGDAGALAEAIARLAENAEMRAALGAAARDRVTSTFEERRAAVEVRDTLAPFLGHGS
jgi:glycosyltransferase involved in cell wall biosynthesis